MSCPVVPSMTSASHSTPESAHCPGKAIHPRRNPPAHHRDGNPEPDLGLPPHPRRTQRSRPHRRSIHRLEDPQHHRIDPAPQRSTVTWTQFLQSQAAVACDFATADTSSSEKHDRFKQADCTKPGTHQSTHETRGDSDRVFGPDTPQRRTTTSVNLVTRRPREPAMNATPRLGAPSCQ
jgi:hypothetical protein